MDRLRVEGTLCGKRLRRTPADSLQCQVVRRAGKTQGVGAGLEARPGIIWPELVKAQMRCGSGQEAGRGQFGFSPPESSQLEGGNELGLAGFPSQPALLPGSKKPLSAALRHSPVCSQPPPRSLTEY